MGEATAKRFAAAPRCWSPPAARRRKISRRHFIPADLSSEQGVAKLGRRVLDAVAGVDVLVNNAGVASELAPTLRPRPIR
jgi:NAD(P)-dependent dehydrogenase (short-subunit alcohol dehydrogenase family)